MNFMVFINFMVLNKEIECQEVFEDRDYHEFWAKLRECNLCLLTIKATHRIVRKT